MRCRHSPCAPGDLIQWSPKCFNCLAIYLSATFNKAWQIPSEAGIPVPMDMEKTNAQSELQAIRNLEMPAASHPVLHMNAPLTHNIVANESCLDAIHVKIQGFKYRIIHVFLTIGESVSPSMLIDMGTQYSRFTPLVLPRLGSELAWQAEAGHFATRLTGPILGKVAVPMTVDST